MNQSSKPQVLLLKVSRQQMKNNNYLVVDPLSRQAVVVDPAWQLEKIEEGLAQVQATLSGILLTHAHFDHVDLAKPLAELYNCPIWMSEREIAASGFNAPQLVGIESAPWFVGNMCIRPIATPGHTPGCVCYAIGDNLFTGDVLFAEGCGVCSGLDAAYDMFDSLELLKAQVAPQTHVFPGHTYVRPPGQRFAELQRWNMYLQFTDRDSFAAYRLRKGQKGLLNFS
ncbi:MAG: MBL fold metallo-hydrolase [Steroidobacteraceae bacterium]